MERVMDAPVIEVMHSPVLGLPPLRQGDRREEAPYCRELVGDFRLLFFRYFTGDVVSGDALSNLDRYARIAEEEVGLIPARYREMRKMLPLAALLGYHTGERSIGWFNRVIQHTPMDDIYDLPDIGRDRVKQISRLVEDRRVSLGMEYTSLSKVILKTMILYRMTTNLENPRFATPERTLNELKFELKGADFSRPESMIAQFLLIDRRI